jgi:hypothetical protein
MKLSNKKQFLSLSLVSFMVLAGCSTQLNNAPEAKTGSKQVVSPVTDKTQIKGKIVFPDSFNTKVSVSLDVPVKTLATVTLLYPTDYHDPALRDSAIATSLTDDAGDFTMALDSFKPRTDIVYVLEAAKRIGGAGNFQMAIRTFVRWDGDNWESMTSGDLEVNTTTTALSIIAGLNPLEITAEETINFIPSFCSSVADNICSDLSNVEGLVNTILDDGQDPVATIYFFENEYNVRTYPGNEIAVFNSTENASDKPLIDWESLKDKIKKLK